MQFLGDSARYVHIIFGSIGLLACWVPLFARKGAVNHVRFGKVFVGSAYIVLAAATVALSSRLADLVARGIGPADEPTLYAFIFDIGLKGWYRSFPGLRRPSLASRRSRSGPGTFNANLAS